MILYRYEPREALEIAMDALEIPERDKNRALELFREAEENFFGDVLSVDEPSPFTLRIAGLLPITFNNFICSSPERERAYDLAIKLEKPIRILAEDLF